MNPWLWWLNDYEGRNINDGVGAQSNDNNNGDGEDVEDDDDEDDDDFFPFFLPLFLLVDDVPR